MKYLLMNKNRKIALIEIMRSSAYILETYDVIPVVIGDIQGWIDSRTSPVGRRNIDTMLKLAGIRSKEEFLKITYGISLNDTYWFKTPDDIMTWERISPYSNRLSRVVSEICLNGEYRYNGSFESPSPDYVVDGSVDKCWKRVDGKLYLYKTTGECWSGIAGLRTYMEYYASQVARQLIGDKSHFIPYGIKVSKTPSGFRKPYAYCRCFTTENYSLVQYGNSAFARMPLNELHDNILDTRSQLILREMLILDSVIVNYDRHSYNYGFLMNNDTFRIVGLAPIYDNDCSMGHFVSLQDIENANDFYIKATSKLPRTEMGNYIDQAKWAMTDELLSNLRNMYPFHFDRLRDDIDVDTNRIKAMEYLVNRQIKTIVNAMKM